jgi:hypothetical protein
MRAQVGNPLHNDARDANTIPEYRVEVGPGGGECLGARRATPLDGLLAQFPRPDSAASDRAARKTLQAIRRLPQLKKLDGIPVDVDERDQARGGGGA